MKILIVEDEPKTGDYLRQGLSEAGFVVDLVRDGLDGLHLARSGDYDLLVLDVMLPGANGWEILRTVRQTGQELPVLFLTARDAVDDRVRGLELGVADLELDPLRRRVSRAGVRIDLTAKEFALLELLLRRQGEVLPRSLIASQVWDMNFDSDTNVIEVAVRRLRAKVDEPFPVRLIRTVRGMGYVLEPPESA